MAPRSGFCARTLSVLAALSWLPSQGQHRNGAGRSGTDGAGRSGTDCAELSGAELGIKTSAGAMRSLSRAAAGWAACL